MPCQEGMFLHLLQKEVWNFCLHPMDPRMMIIPKQICQELRKNWIWAHPPCFWNWLQVRRISNKKQISGYFHWRKYQIRNRKKKQKSWWPLRQWTADVAHHLTPRYLRLWLNQLCHAIKPCQTVIREIQNRNGWRERWYSRRNCDNYSQC